MCYHIREALYFYNSNGNIATHFRSVYLIKKSQCFSFNCKSREVFEKQNLGCLRRPPAYFKEVVEC